MSNRRREAFHGQKELEGSTPSVEIWRNEWITELVNGWIEEWMSKIMNEHILNNLTSIDFLEWMSIA